MAAHLKIVYKILSMLRDVMEEENFDCNAISHESLGIPYPLWCRLIKMIEKSSYIEGVQV